MFVILSKLSVHCSLVVTCWKRANLLALLNVMFSSVFATFPCGVLGQVWYKMYLIVLIPGHCLLSYVLSFNLRGYFFNNCQNVFD